MNNSDYLKTPEERKRSRYAGIMGFIGFIIQFPILLIVFHSTIAGDDYSLFN